MSINKILAVFAAVLCLSAAPQAAFAGAKQGAVRAIVTASSLNVRSCASPRCHRIGTVHYGQRLRVRGCNHRWCKVRVHGRTGYVSSRYISFRRSHGHVQHNPRPHRPRHSSSSVTINGNQALGIAAALAAGYVIYQHIND